MRRGDGLTWAAMAAALLAPIGLDVRAHPDHLVAAIALVILLATILVAGIAIARLRASRRERFR